MNSSEKGREGAGEGGRECELVGKKGGTPGGVENREGERGEIERKETTSVVCAQGVEEEAAAGEGKELHDEESQSVSVATEGATLQAAQADSPARQETHLQGESPQATDAVTEGRQCWHPHPRPQHTRGTG